MRAARASLVFVLALVSAALLAQGCSAGIQNDGSYRFGHDVPESERAPIRAGVNAMRSWLEAEGNVHLKALNIEVDDNINTLVSRYAYYNEGDPLVTAQWLVSGGALATGDTVYIYIGNEWEDMEDWQKSLVAAHEVFHVAQYGFLFDDWWLHERDVPDAPPAWIIEGGADYAAARALDRAGIRAYSGIQTEVVEHARGFPDSLASISGPEGDYATGDAAPYAVGFLAVEQLASEHGEAAMFNFWDALSDTGGWEPAFARAYGLPASDFVAGVDRTRAKDPSILHAGISGRITRDSAAVAGANVIACSRVSFECKATWTADDGEFSLALEPGEYELFYRVVTRESTERGKFSRHGERLETVTIADAWVDDLEANVRKPL